jgi:Fibronectin type III-like domain
VSTEGGADDLHVPLRHRLFADVPQLYLTEATGDARMRLVGFERVELQPSEWRTLTLEADARRPVRRGRSQPRP